MTEILTFNDHHVEIKLDTVAKANITSKQVFNKLDMNDQQLTKTHVKLVRYCVTEITPKVIKTLECAAKSLTCHFHSGCEYSRNSGKECMYRN